MRVDAHEDLPEKISAINTDNAESREDANTWTVAKRTDSEWDSEGTENIRGDLVY